MSCDKTSTNNVILPNWLNRSLIPNECPILDIGQEAGHTDYIDFIGVKDVTHPIMCGIDKYKRPFITLRVFNRNTDETSVHTLFQRYSEVGSTLWCYGTCYECIVDHCPRDADREYLNRLLKHEPCGESVFYGKEGERTTVDGLSVVELI